jgi:spermidine synthase
MAAPHASTPKTVWLNRLLPLTALVSAWLLFQIQPIVAKRILPWFGGGAAVWTTALLFFQTALLGGYLYAHLSVRWMSPRLQAAVHVALLAAAALLAALWGVIPTDVWKPQDSEAPSLRILVILAAWVGLPYLMLAATAPLVQVWFSRTSPGRSPYRLYALSNVGSMAALASYPLLVEPAMGIVRQGESWAWAFLAFAAACGGCALLAAPAGDRDSIVPVAGGDSPALDARPGWLQAALWLALPACASVLLLAVTTYLCQDVAPIPMLWVAPMAIYLLTFILAFDSDRWYRRGGWLPMTATATLAAVLLWGSRTLPSFAWQGGVHLVLLFAACMTCHGELARMRPAIASRLTTYYLCIAAGGALGGLLTGVAAPMLLGDHYELQIAIVAMWALVLLVLVTDRRSAFYDGGSRGALATLAAMVVALVALAITLYVRAASERRSAVARARNFYGVLKVLEVNRGTSDAYYELANGRISHGAQFEAAANRRVPMCYYYADSGIGQVLMASSPASPRRVGVVGLGVGSLAAYAEAGEQFRFYEINPQVATMAEEYFSYLADARERGAQTAIVPGDARLSLEREPPQRFDVLALDAFNGDAIPMHLLTLEAFDLYLRHLAADGILAIHITNQHLRLDGVVKAPADRHGLDAVRVETTPAETPGTTGCVWVLLSRRAGYFAERKLGPPLEDLPGKATVPWTDDYSNLLEALLK